MAGEIADLRIERLSAGGDGVAREASGRVVFVPLAAPGDLVRVRLRDARKRFARADVLELLEPGAARVQPPCPVFGVCGGCAWQHVAYPAQLSAKAEIVSDALRRIGGFELEKGAVRVTPSPSPYGYRNRARLLQEGASLGYRMRRSHALCAVEACPVLQPELSAVLARKRTPLAGGVSREWEISIGISGAPRARPLDEPCAAGIDAVDVCAGEDLLRISPGVFAQANAGLLGPLRDAVVREATSGGATTSALELYAGAGLFTLGLARRFDWVTAVESQPNAVADLRFNLRRARLANADVRPGEVEEVLPRLEVRNPDVVVVDPPRAGLSREAMAELERVGPRRVVYVSCDPATLARDLAVLRGSGHRLLHVEAFDLFPQTPHVEALAVSERPP
jgi:23S rRNA (uracil1939-C5)-methyltransferase